MRIVILVVGPLLIALGLFWLGQGAELFSRVAVAQVSARPS